MRGVAKWRTRLRVLEEADLEKMMEKQDESADIHLWAQSRLELRPF